MRSRHKKANVQANLETIVHATVSATVRSKLLPARTSAPRQGGAALLSAMLTVALVASFAASALWQQWRIAEIESAERARTQAQWILTGALDWARLILREDARSGGADHLGEPWALPLQEARLSSFLAADKNNSAGDTTLPAFDAFLSGQITDAQSRLNLFNLIDNNKVSEADFAVFERLFQLLDLPPQELTQLAVRLKNANEAKNDEVASSQTAVWPQRLEQLAWLGLSTSSIKRLQAYVCLIPARTALNINTASAQALSASLPDLSLSQAQRLVEERTRKPWQQLTEANALREKGRPFSAERHSVTSRFFEVYGRLRQDSLALQEYSLVQRDGLNVKVIWRDRSRPEDLR